MPLIRQRDLKKVFMQASIYDHGLILYGATIPRQKSLVISLSLDKGTSYIPRS